MSFAVWLCGSLLGLAMLGLVSARPRLWARRRLYADIVTALLLVTIPFLFASALPVFSLALLLVCQMWALILAQRLVNGRLPELLLRSGTRLNVLLLLLIILCILALSNLISGSGARERYQVAAFVMLMCSLLAASVLVYQTFWTLKHYRLRKLNKYLTRNDLPTVTLAIPARNETHVLGECLQAAVASDYLKLEILVLDDCSQDKTSEIIRSFAHDGVRFVQGKLPADGWLGKNQAMQTLSEQASGDYIVFAGVDTRLDIESLRQLVTYAVSNNVDMVSVLPQRRDKLTFSTCVWQLRYYWQVALPMTPRRIPIASQCWLIRTKKLKQLGGFAAVKHKIVPEGSFAHQLFLQDRYRFIISNPELGITTAKRWTSQTDTAIRFLYPTFKRQPVYILIGCLLLGFFVPLPIALAIILPFLGHFTLLWLLAIIVTALYLVSYMLIVMRAVPAIWPLLLVSFPLSLIQELCLLVVSMLAYEFAEVNWKGRNICYPVMKTYAHLPSVRRRA